MHATRASTHSGVYDVIVLGSGLAGSTLAAILARHGLEVLLLEAGSHPRFAIGESVVPEFGARAQLLAHAYDVPELAHMADFRGLSQRVSANSGIKRNFTFLHHQAGHEHDARHTWQFQTLTYPLGPDSHIYRPDLDAWLTALAIRYGAHYVERCPVTGVEILDHHVVVSTAGGGRTKSAGNGRSGSGDATARTFTGRFVVDGTGYRSILASTLSLRQPIDLATNSRSIFTHVVRMRRIEEVCRGSSRLTVPSPPDQGTLHHVFDGGWFWVIPFDNHKEARNPLCSVGLTLDGTRYPDDGLAGDEEFFAFAERFPTVANQFADICPARSFTKTKRLQFHSSRVAGDRFCLLPHSASFVDPLFSGGMTLTLMGVHEVARVLLETSRSDSHSAAAFADYQRSSRENLEVVDRIVHGAYVSMRSPDLFNAWFRHWAVGNFHAVMGLTRVRLEYESTRDEALLGDLASPACRLILGMGHPRLRQFLDRAYAIARDVDSGAVSAEQGSDRLFNHLADQSWIPRQFHIADRERSHLAAFTALPLMSIAIWGRYNTPEDMRKTYYRLGSRYYQLLTRTLLEQGWRSTTAFFRTMMGAHFSRSRA